MEKHSKPHICLLFLLPRNRDLLWVAGTAFSEPLPFHLSLSPILRTKSPLWRQRPSIKKRFLDLSALYMSLSFPPLEIVSCCRLQVSPTIEQKKKFSTPCLLIPSRLPPRKLFRDSKSDVPLREDQEIILELGCRKPRLPL